MSARRSEYCEKKAFRKSDVEISANMAVSKSMELSRQLDKMNAAELRNLTATLLAQLAERDAERSEQAALIAKRDAELKAKQLKIDQLTHEMAILKRWRYRSAQRAARSRAALAPG